ncbi:MAG: hypothetical protein A2167_01160 [Planctomycetes bacterium RBG_13_46_10]|nr:MAG: hypothetical protein A2167_01160 [Planctomycetes bacterium RBG_13_46_10]
MLITNNTVKKVCLLGASFNTGNLGVSALAESSIKVILNRWPDAEIVLLGNEYKPHQQILSIAGREICVQIIPVRLCKNIFLPYHFLWFLLYGLLVKILPNSLYKAILTRRNPYIKTLYEADLAVDITGGDSFSDIYGSWSFLLRSLPKFLVLLYGKTLIMLPQTYGPFNKRVTKLLAKHALKHADLVYSRDIPSLECIRELLNNCTAEKVRFTPDVAFVLDPRRPDNQEICSIEKIKTNGTTLIGFNVSGLLSCCGSNEDNVFNLGLDYTTLVGSIIESLMKRNDTAILLVPHVAALQKPDNILSERAHKKGYKEQSDVVACTKVYEQLCAKYKDRIYIVRGRYNHNETKYIIGLCDFFIGARMHACIAAISQGIPAVGLSYSKKFRGVFESVGIGELAVDLREKEESEVLEAIDKAFENRKNAANHLRNTIPAAQTRIQNMFEDMDEQTNLKPLNVIKVNLKNRSNKNRETIQTIVDHKICCGCGACTVICPTSCIDLVYGKRFNYPKIDAERCIHCSKCLKVCPSSFLLKGTDPDYPHEEQKNLTCYLAYSPDDDVRLDASSGGFITGLILHLMKKGQADGAIVTRCEGEEPWIAKSFIATTREELLSARASKYAPVSSCVTLKKALEKPGRYVFVGTPCMIEGLRRIQNIIPEMKERIILAIGLVCAGVASRQSTIAFLQRYAVSLKQAYKIAYRGGGWPGYFKVFDAKGQTLLKKPLLGGSLDLVVPSDHYLRCWNCLDHWARFADIAVSDPWCDEMVDNETKGWSGIMVRTQSGQWAVDSSIYDGDIIAKNVSVDQMYGYNKHLTITSTHPRHTWMALYQLIFFGRFKGLKSVIGNVIRKKGTGLLTTLRARFDKNYYENESVRKKLLKIRPGATEHLRKRSEIAHNKY